MAELQAPKIGAASDLASVRVEDFRTSERWAAYRADCVQWMQQLPESSVDMVMYSPPFSGLYTYSASPLDMGNVYNDESFFEHYDYAVAELMRIMRPGRLCLVHCKELVNYKGRDGMAGLRDFPGDLIRAHTAHGFAFHSRITLWRNPVTEMQKTKAHGLLYRQLRKDSTFARVGLPEYVLAFRKWALRDDQQQEVAPVEHTKEEFPLERWQRWASPVWDDIDYTRVLNAEIARGENDEKHMAALPLDVATRCVELWSNPEDVVLSPFMGVGSEGYEAVRMGRKFIGCELKDSYFEWALRYLGDAEAEYQGYGQHALFEE